MAISMTSAGIVYTGTQSPAQSGGSGAAYTLDDYEEGTWTPAFSMSGTQMSGYSEQKGHYLKVGDVAHIWFSLWVNSKGSASGTCYIGSLPFTSYNGTNYQGTETGQPYCYHITGGSPGEPIFLFLGGNVTSIQVLRNDHRATSGTPSSITSSHMGTYPSLMSGMHYHCKS
jgi:hypothetical protein